MQGRLRVIADDSVGKTIWAEVPSEYWTKYLEKGQEVPVIEESNMSVGTDIPDYEGTLLSISLVFFIVHA